MLFSLILIDFYGILIKKQKKFIYTKNDIVYLGPSTSD